MSAKQAGLFAHEQLVMLEVVMGGGGALHLGSCTCNAILPSRRTRTLCFYGRGNFHHRAAAHVN